MASQEDASWQIRHPSIVAPDGEPPRLYPYQCNICCLFLTAGIEALEEHVAEHRSKLRARLEALQHEEGADTGHMWDYLGGPPAASGIAVQSQTQEQQHQQQQQQQFQTHPQPNVSNQTAWYPSSSSRAVSWSACRAGAVSAAGAGSIAVGPLQPGETGTATAVQQEQAFGSAHLAQDSYGVAAAAGYASQGLYYDGSGIVSRIPYTDAGGSSPYAIPSDGSLAHSGGIDGETAVSSEQLQGSTYRGSAVQYAPNTNEVHVDHVYLTSNVPDTVIGSRNVMYYGLPHPASVEMCTPQRSFRRQVQIQQQDYATSAGYGQQQQEPAPMGPPEKQRRVLGTPPIVPSGTAPPSFTDPPRSEGQIEPSEVGDTSQSQPYQQDAGVHEFTAFATAPTETTPGQHLSEKLEGQWNQAPQPENLFAGHETVDVTILAEPPSAPIDQAPMERPLTEESSEMSESSPQPPPPASASTPIAASMCSGTDSNEQDPAHSSDSLYFDRLACSLQIAADPHESGHPNHDTVGLQQQQQHHDAQQWISAQFLGHCGESGSSKDHERLYSTDTGNDCEMAGPAGFASLDQHDAAIAGVDQAKEGPPHFAGPDKFKVEGGIEQAVDEYEGDMGTSSTTRSQAEEIIDAILNIACLKDEQDPKVVVFKDEKLDGLLSADSSLPVQSGQSGDFANGSSLESTGDAATDVSLEQQ